MGVRRFWGPHGQLGSGSHQRPLAFGGNGSPLGITGPLLGRWAGRRGDDDTRNGTGMPAPTRLHRSPILGKGDPPLWEHPRGAAGAHASGRRPCCHRAPLEPAGVGVLLRVGDCPRLEHLALAVSGEQPRPGENVLLCVGELRYLPPLFGSSGGAAAKEDKANAG